MQRRFVALLLLLLLLLQCRAAFASTVIASECDAKFWPSELARMKGFLDESVEPCDDFFEYACGYWRAPYYLRALQARDTLTALKAANQKLLLDYFEQQWTAQNRSTLPRNAAKCSRVVRDFYESCLDEKLTKSQKGGLQAYRDLMLGISDWPLLNASYAERSFDWLHVSARLRRYGVQSFWRLLVQPNWQSADQMIFYLAPPQFEWLSRASAAAADDDDDDEDDEDDDDEEVFLHKRYIKYLMLDLNVRVRDALRIAEDVVDFELELRALSNNTRDVELREPQTLASLQHELPALNFSKYFASLLAEEASQLRPDYERRLLVVADKAYLRRLAAFLSRSDAATIGEYLLVQVLAHFEVHQHQHESYAQQKQSCLQQAHNLLPQQASQLFLELQHADSDAFLQRTQRELSLVFAQLKRQFEKMLNATHIFERDAVTRALGLEKLRAMRLLLPQRAETRNDDDDDDDDDDDEDAATPMTHDYNRNLLQLSRSHATRELNSILNALNALKSRVERDRATFTAAADTPQYGPLNVNAYYRLKKNAIELPIGILRAPVYDRCSAPANIYGSLVYMLAHELLHGFDYDGLNYDESGRVANAWDAKSIIQFGSRSSCYMASRHSNAPLNINENIADSEGLRLALATFLQSDAHAASRRTEQLQLFFTSFGQTWCGTDAGRAGSLHAGHKERVNNVVRNFDEFAEAFGCRKDSAMNPAEKCRIW